MSLASGVSKVRTPSRHWKGQQRGTARCSYTCGGAGKRGEAGWHSDQPPPSLHGSPGGGDGDEIRSKWGEVAEPSGSCDLLTLGYHLKLPTDTSGIPCTITKCSFFAPFCSQPLTHTAQWGEGGREVSWIKPGFTASSLVLSEIGCRRPGYEATRLWGKEDHIKLNKS